MKCNI